MIKNNFLWEFYPYFPGQLLLFYLIGISFIKRKFSFTILVLILFTALLFFHRKPVPEHSTTISTQICNIDGRCRTLSSTAFLQPKNILSPAFGKIARITDDGQNITISIVLSLLDIHAQYCPTAGQITYKKYFPGEFNLSGILEKSDLNEHSYIEITTEGRKVGIKRIAGVITRRITTAVEKNDSVKRGEYLGFIHLGSRVDLILPLEGVNLIVKEGDRVDGFNTVIGNWFGP